LLSKISSTISDGSCAQALLVLIRTRGIDQWSTLANVELDEAINILGLAHDSALVDELESMLNRAALMEQSELRTLAFSSTSSHVQPVPLRVTIAPSQIPDQQCFSFSASGPPKLLRSRGSCAFPAVKRLCNLRGGGILQKMEETLDKVELKLDAVPLRRKCALEEIWQAYLELAHFGSYWDKDRVEDKLRVGALKAIMLEEWNEAQSLAAHVSTLDLWRQTAAAQSIDWRTPDVVTVKVFLKIFSADGPTVAKSRLNSLKWLTGCLGVSFDTGNVRIKKEGRVADDHVERQADPIRLRLSGSFWNDFCNRRISSLWQSYSSGCSVSLRCCGPNMPR
jgi:hypothetical protein